MRFVLLPAVLAGFTLGITQADAMSRRGAAADGVAPERAGRTQDVSPLVLAGPGAGGGYEQRIRTRKKRSRA